MIKTFECVLCLFIYECLLYNLGFVSTTPHYTGGFAVQTAVTSWLKKKILTVIASVNF